MKPTLMQECYDKYITEEIKERMTHEEEIRKYAPEVLVTGHLFSTTFIDGMKFREEHPKNPWRKTPFNTSDKEAGRFVGKKYIVSVNGEIHKATYKGYGCWTLENGKTATENKFTEVYWIPIPELPKGGEK